MYMNLYCPICEKAVECKIIREDKHLEVITICCNSNHKFIKRYDKIYEKNKGDKNESFSHN